MKSAYNKQCSNFLKHPFHVVNNWTLQSQFKSTWEKTVSEDSIRQGVRAFSKVPLNPNAVPVSAYEPSKPTDAWIVKKSLSYVYTAEDQAATKSLGNSEDDIFKVTPIFDNVKTVIDNQWPK